MASINQQGNYMVKYDLNRLQKNSARMQKALPTSGPLPEWAKSKLTEARSKVAYVADYQDSKLGLTNNEKSTLANIANELNAASAKHKGQANRIRNLGSTIGGQSVGWAFIGAILGNTLLAKRFGKNLADSLDVGFQTAGAASVVAGGFTISNGIADENVTKLAAGGALMGLGLFYYGIGNN